MKLKTTPEERAAWRAAFDEGWDAEDVKEAPLHLLSALDDLDTLAAEVRKYRNELRTLLRHAEATYPTRKRVDIGHQAPLGYHLSAMAYAHIVALCRAANISSDQDDE